jgi:hypothetical protein
VPAEAGSDWSVRSFDTTELHVASADSIDKRLVDELVEDFRKSPMDRAYPELALSRVLESGGARRYFIFDIRYVDDVSVVYALDSHNVILDKFITSPWKK